jgi:hypothetical protein
LAKSSRSFRLESVSVERQTKKKKKKKKERKKKESNLAGQ